MGKESYCCVLRDLDRNFALDVLPHRSKDTLIISSCLALRNDFHLRFESATNHDELEQALLGWIAKARTTKQRSLIDFIHMLKNWLRPVANFAHQRLTNAATEGYNNVIIYGLPKFEHIRLRVLAQALRPKNYQRTIILPIAYAKTVIPAHLSKNCL